MGEGLERPYISLERVWTLSYMEQGTMEEKCFMQGNDMRRCTWEGRFVILSKIYFKDTQHRQCEIHTHLHIHVYIHIPEEQLISEVPQ